MKRITLGTLGVLRRGTALAGCGGTMTAEAPRTAVAGEVTPRSSTAAPSPSGCSSDPGNLDPQMGAGSALFTVTQFAYDPLLSVDAETGEIRSAAGHELGGRGHDGHAHPGRRHHLRRRHRLTATDVADNLNFVADPKNESPFLGTFLPVGATAEGDDAAGTVTITLTHPAPFVLNGLASLPDRLPERHGRPRQARDGHRRHRPLRAHRGSARRPLHLHDPRRLHLGPGRRDDRDRGSSRHRRGRRSSRTRRPRPTCCSPAA